jgi:hypothetical protein
MHMTVDRRIPFYRFYRQCTGISTKIGILPRPRYYILLDLRIHCLSYMPKYPLKMEL